MKSHHTESQVSFEKFLAHVDTIRMSAGVDLSTSEDLTLAVMNLVSLEEHFFFTAMKTGKDQYLETSVHIRELRKELLAQLMPEHEGETWCVSKHLLSASMRLIEVGNKLQSEGKKEDAHEMFQKAYRVYAIFFALKLGLVGVGARKPEREENTKWRLEDLVAKLDECCDE